MSNQYLDNFRSKLPTAQGRQILNRLISKRDSGEIRTIDEFKTKLKELTTDLLSEHLKPTLRHFLAVGGEDINSEQYNEMLRRIQDDLSAAFEEADNIDDVIEAHRNLIQDVSLKAIRFGVNQLEAKVSLYEFLDKNSGGFDDALFNTFSESENLATSRADAAAALVYVDPRLSKTISSQEDAQTDVIGERLTLGPDEVYYVNIHDVQWLSNANSSRSEVNVEFENSNIRNIIDNTKNTFWVTPTLTKKVQSGGVSTELEFTLPALQDVNFLEIEPASDAPMVLTTIGYFNSNSSRVDIDISDVMIWGPTRVNFERITTRRLVLRFRQDNYKEVQFKNRLGASNFHKAVLSQTNVKVDIDAVSDDLREVLTSNYIKSDIFNLTNNTNSVNKYYEYITGFDNIRLGYNIYDERSIFVSAVKEVDTLGVAAVRVLETRPYRAAGSADVTLENFTYPPRSGDSDGDFYLGSVEYWLAVQSFSAGDFLISTDIVPILPLGAERIYHERLLLTAKSGSLVSNNDIGSMMFYTNADATDVLVYRNATLLNSSTEWSFVSDSDASEATQPTPNVGSRMKRGIQITGTVQPLDIYTVSYTPVLSNTITIPSDDTLFTVVDLVGDQSMRMIKDNSIIIDSVKSSYTVAKSKVYLMIIMRRNTGDANFSPAVEEYMLVTGSRDQNKFVGE